MSWSNKNFTISSGVWTIGHITMVIMADSRHVEF
jgi:hypothetical protein